MATTDVSWQVVLDRLTLPRSYWLSTVGRKGAPHVAPMWGVVVDGVWFCYSERTTAKARNLRSDPRVALHLADPDDVVIVHGTVEDVGHPSSRTDVLAAFAAKYTRPADLPYLPDADPVFDVLYELRPTQALLWTFDNYEHGQLRWRL